MLARVAEPAGARWRRLEALADEETARRHDAVRAMPPDLARLYGS